MHTNFYNSEITLGELSGPDPWGFEVPPCRIESGGSSFVGKREGMKRAPKLHGEKAFSLVELLVVMAIIALISSLTIPALSALKDEGDVDQTVSGISLALDQARAYAMSHNAYVWVGFMEPTGSQKLTVGMVTGATGESSDLNLQVPSSQPAYTPIAKLQAYPNISVTKVTSVEASNSNSSWTASIPSGTDLDTSNLPSFTQSAGGTTTTFPPGSILQFNPQGEASLSTTGQLQHWIQFGLQPIRGAKTNGQNVAIIQVAALSGQVQVFRP